MKVFEIQGPDGQIYEVEADSIEKAAEAVGALGRGEKTTGLEQFANGLNQGVSTLAGFPVDTATGLINAGVQGVNNLTGADIPQITNPVGGSQMISDGLESAGAITGAEPQTRAQRYLNRAGKELGFGLPAAVLTGGLMQGARVAPVLTGGAAADTAAAVAGQTSRELAPENDALDMIASILAGGTTAATMGGRMRSKDPAPFNTTDEMFDEADNILARVGQSDAGLSPQAQREMFDRLDNVVTQADADPDLFPRTFKTLEKRRARPHTSLSDVEQTRRLIGRDVAGNKDEAAVGVALKNEIDSYLREIGENSAEGVVQGADAEQAVADLIAQRQLRHQAHKAQAIEGSQYRAERRAATSGRGGNEVNARRQNIGAILDNEVAPRRAGARSGYTPDEVAQMERIAFGTPGQNRLRWAAGMAPSGGVMPAMISGGGLTAGVTAAAALNNPLPLAAAVPGTVGEIAKALAERSTRKDIDRLLDTVRRNGMTAQPPRISETGRALRALGGVHALDSLIQQ